MAKGVEDTVFYLYNRFIALNEVGGDPSRFGISTDEFHAAAAAAQQQAPQAMLATATHDTKRGEDVRARLALLSERHEDWATAVARWSELATGHRTGEWPDRNTEYFFYQTLVGAWPLEAERALAYLEKATREAKAHTSWTSPDAAYDQALRRFIEGVLGDQALMADVAAFVEPMIRPGWINAISQALLKLTAPGVPDIYQGTELWSLHLVDPDNRRPVDYEVRRRILADLQSMPPEEIWTHADEGHPKLHLVHQALRLRQRRPELFGADSTYAPLAARGACAGHVIAFVRGGAAVTVAQRQPWALAGAWRDTTVDLPPGEWRNLLTGEQAAGEVTLAQLLGRFPAALLERGGGTA